MRSKCKLGEIITQRREKYNGEPLPICGVSKDGFIPPKQKEADLNLYNVFYIYIYYNRFYWYISLWIIYKLVKMRDDWS